MKVRLTSVLAICVLILVLSSFACKKQTTQWEGTISAENIYVLDSKEKNVLVFDNSGRHLRTFGRPG